MTTITFPLDLTRPLVWNRKPVRLLTTDSTARPGLPCVGLAKWPDGYETLLEFSKDGITVVKMSTYTCEPITNAYPTVVFTPTGEVRPPVAGEWYLISSRIFVQWHYTGASPGASYPIYTRTETYE